MRLKASPALKGLLSAQRRRRWNTIKPTVVQRLAFAGKWSFMDIKGAINTHQMTRIIQYQEASQPTGNHKMCSVIDGNYGGYLVGLLVYTRGPFTQLVVTTQ